MHATEGRTHDSLWSPQRRALTIGLILTVTLVAAEALAIATIMPIVADDLGDLQLYGWVFSSFLLGSLLGIVVAGRIVDRFGLVLPFVGGLVVFGAGLVICGVAPTMPVLVAGRLIQGFGAGAIPPIGYVAIGRSMPERLRPQMFNLFAMAWVLPGIVGPSIAAVVATQLHWRAVFIGLLPLIALSGLMTLLPLLRVPPAARSDEATAMLAEREARRGPPLAVALAIGAGLLIAGLTSALVEVMIPLTLAGLVVGLAAFKALTPPGTLRLVRGLPAAILLRGALTFAFLGADTFSPLALQGWRGLSPALTGVVITVVTLAWTAGSWIQTRFIPRLGPEWFLRVSLFMVTIGLAGTMLVLAPGIPIEVGLVALTSAAVGIGMGYSAASLIVLRDALPGREGASTSALQLSDVLGTVLGTGIGGAFIAAGERAGAEPWLGLAGAFGTFVVVAALGFAGSWRLFPAPKPAGVVAARPAREAA
ncbi:MAG: MFS transporter [Chloroflexi bacterium]|nr:MFS transporter [Chloroflexota bacterium]